MNSGEQNSFRASTIAMAAAIAVGIGVMGLKFYGYWITGSSAILSDALESIINVVAAIFAFGSLLLSAKPPDETHPYGHGKIEFFSAGFEGALIILAAAGVFIEGMWQILNPQPLPRLENGLLVLLAASVVNLVLGIVLVQVGRKSRSLVVEADGKHVLTDVYTSGGVLVGLVIVYFTGYYRLDGVVACFVGLNIVITGLKIVREAFGGLMDASDPALLQEICSVLEAHRKPVWIDVHRLRAWRSGKRVHIDFHLILPRIIPLVDGHREVKELEEIFSNHFDSMAEVLVHLDPCSDPECPLCRQDPCGLRREGKAIEHPWHRERLTCDAEARLNVGRNPVY